MGIVEEFRSRNFSIYAQWAGLLSILLLVLFGILAFTTFSVATVFAVIAWVIAFILVFVEVPIFLKICPTSSRFDSFIKKFKNHYVRAVGYLVCATILWLFLIRTFVLIAPAITLTAAGIFYGIAAVTHQPHASSSITGGTGVS
ncbi:10779_t:CDS:2, partial [Paraglomus occultum]